MATILDSVYIEEVHHHGKFYTKALFQMVEILVLTYLLTFVINIFLTPQGNNENLQFISEEKKDVWQS